MHSLDPGENRVCTIDVACDVRAIALYCKLLLYARRLAGESPVSFVLCQKMVYQYPLGEEMSGVHHDKALSGINEKLNDVFGTGSKLNSLSIRNRAGIVVW